jgi:hypothetical protein
VEVPNLSHPTVDNRMRSRGVRQELISGYDHCSCRAGVPKLGQRGEVQDLMAKAFVGSNPTPCTF